MFRTVFQVGLSNIQSLATDLSSKWTVNLAKYVHLFLHLNGRALQSTNIFTGVKIDLPLVISYICRYNVSVLETQNSSSLPIKLTRRFRLKRNQCPEIDCDDYLRAIKIDLHFANGLEPDSMIKVTLNLQLRNICFGPAK